MSNVPASLAFTMKGSQPGEPSVIRKGVFNGAEVDENIRRSTPTAFAFDPILERQRELEERDAADGYGRSVPIGKFKYLWFAVIFVFIAMFLCLFLYTFQVLK
jgi:hypothetical protein